MVPIDKQIIDLSLSRSDKLRRAIILCQSFMRNLAYYRIGQEPKYSRLIKYSSPFQCFLAQANANFIDMAVLEWCKLLGDGNAKYYYAKLFRQPQLFRTKLEALSEFRSITFDGYVTTIRAYRDAFVAHLDNERDMNIPMLDGALASVKLYHAEIIGVEAGEADLTGLCNTSEKFDLGYQQCEHEARQFLDKFLL